jgi:hypothetical protein
LFYNLSCFIKQILNHLCEALADELLIQVAALQERMLDTSPVKHVEDVRGVPTVDVEFARVNDDGAGYGELFADVGSRRSWAILG